MKLLCNDKAGNNLVQSRSRNEDHLKFCKFYLIEKMACQLQPECNFLHGFFKCKLPIEVVDVEVKVTSMQGTHLYKRDQTMQVTKCVLLTNNIHPHPNIIKKMKTFLEVENKMGMTIQTSMQNNQFRPPLPQTNLNICRSDIVERRKTIMPKEKFRPVTPKVTATNPPLPQANNENPPTIRADPHGQVLAKCQATWLMIDNGFYQKVINPHRIRRRRTLTLPP